ncbi:hypothetical protein, partial [Pseudomonas siliginis]|uniref:hypothetical protein n=1 Tax=Pseudomonas siliginis TaxID=2842346 RepID=UPI00211796DB
DDQSRTIAPDGALVEIQGAAEGCDLFIWILKTRSKDRSLQQLLRGFGRWSDRSCQFHVSPL